jgi:hypothetical protein
MSQKQKTTWAKMCEGAARIFLGRTAGNGGEGAAATALPERPLPDLEGNDRTLAQTPEGDPMYRALMDHAFVVFENNTAAGLGARGEERARFCDRAAGVLEFVQQVESTRTRLKAEMARRARQAEKQK